VIRFLDGAVGGGPVFGVRDMINTCPYPSGSRPRHVVGHRGVIGAGQAFAGLDEGKMLPLRVHLIPR